MSSELQISIPQAASWLLRLAAHPQLSDNLCRDAVAFSAWYAAANGLLGPHRDMIPRRSGPKVTLVHDAMQQRTRWRFFSGAFAYSAGTEITHPQCPKNRSHLSVPGGLQR